MAAPTISLDPATLSAVARGHAEGLRQHERAAPSPGPGERHYELVLRTDECEVWVIAWGAGSRLPLHDHGESAGAFELVQGELSEVHTSGDADAALVANRLVAGSRRAMAPGDVHEVHNPGVDVAISVHAYSPPLTEMRYYGLTRVAPRADRPGLGDPGY
jgi:predicted metal-dependent enzyme (double-stranded beta helix superfamily)